MFGEIPALVQHIETEPLKVPMRRSARGCLGGRKVAAGARENFECGGNQSRLHAALPRRGKRTESEKLDETQQAHGSDHSKDSSNNNFLPNKRGKSSVSLPVRSD
jgi:hypothetical protein